MKEYKVDVFDTGFKTKKSFEEAFQNLIDERVSQGYVLHSFSTTFETCTAVFARKIERLSCFRR